MQRRQLLKGATGCAFGMLGTSGELHARGWSATPSRSPNILFAIADDWSWPYASIAGQKAIQTPAFDRVAREGCLFTNAFVSAPQCSPNRASLLTGRYIWQLEEAGTHGSIFPAKFTVFPDLLESTGYHVGYTGKAWGPGDWKAAGRKRNPVGPEFNQAKFESVPADGIGRIDYAANFENFLGEREKGVPFSFWFGCQEPHRKYEEGSGARAGKRIEDVVPPAFLPDDPIVRNDLLDYFIEIEWFDSQLGKMLKRLEAMGELDNTLVVVTSDNGMPFPRAKANLYDAGTHVPLAMRWPAAFKPGEKRDSPGSFVDLAPTFLAAAGLDPSNDCGMEGRSLLDSQTPPKRHLEGLGEYVLMGRERHSHARFDNLGYPARAIRTASHLFISNLKEDRWPAGDPEGYHDIDDSPTKRLLVGNKDKQATLFELACGKRPRAELYDLASDPECLKNLAEDPKHADLRHTLSMTLNNALELQGDPRTSGRGEIFDSYPRMGVTRPELGGFSEQGAYNPKYWPGDASTVPRL
ncbi:MAG: hypothetical protein GHCLOJNM_01333 [bacterium]|nr:hypothetical protein [bacterium]